MARTRLVPRQRPNPPPNIDFERQRVAGTKEIRRRIRVTDVKIKFLLPRVKDVEVKHKGKRCQKDESPKSCKTRC